MQSLFLLYTCLLGLLFGSFLALVVVRLPKGESIVSPRSHCRHCGHKLRCFENIPLLSALALRFRCSACKQRFSTEYFFIELLTLLCALLFFFKIQPYPRFLLYFFAFVLPLLALILIDWKHLLLPDKITLPGIILGILVHFMDGRYFLNSSHSFSALLSESGLGILAGGGTLLLLALAYRWLRKKEGLGGGDVKMAAMLGAFLGWKAIFFIFFMASWLGIFVALFWMLFRSKTLATHLPFGSFLGLSSLIYMLYGQLLVQKYLEYIHYLI